MSGFSVGGLLSAAGSIFGALGRKDAAYAQAAAYNRAAGQALNEGAISAQIQLEQADRMSASLAARLGASGGTSQSGLDVLKDVERQLAYGVRQTVVESVNRSQQLRYAARQAKKQGNIELFSGGLTAAGTLYGDYGAQKAKG